MMKINIGICEANLNYCMRLNQKLHRRFGDGIRATEEDGCLVLRGELTRWEDIVEAGRLSVNPSRYDGLINDIRLTGTPMPPMRVPSETDAALDGDAPDVLIIGGGVIGCAIARELSKRRLNVLLVEKEHDVAMHASSRNDGMIHPGIDLLPGQVKRRYNMRGNRMFEKLTGELDVPFLRCGQYLCFQSGKLAAMAFLSQLYYTLLGIPVRFLTGKALRTREPSLSHNIKAALSFPTAGTICPYGLTIALAENAADNGVRFFFDTAVLGMETADKRITAVHTNRGTLHPRIVINAAGVFSDVVADMARDRFFTIHPRKGTNSILDHKAARQVVTIASSFGTAATKSKHTKGGGCVHTIDDNLLIGPDAHETFEREAFSTSAQDVAETFEKQRKTDPALTERDIITSFAGIRASTYEEDFVIRKGRRTRNLVHAAGIQSPGLTAAPAIAEDVAKMALELLADDGVAILANAAFCPVRRGIVRMRELSDEARNTLIAENPDYGEIVCRCEQISKGEILAAMRRSIPCDTLDGVKRRVRPGMGRCQGGFCGPVVINLIAREKGLFPTEVCKSGEGSELLLNQTKTGETKA